MIKEVTKDGIKQDIMDLITLLKTAESFEEIDGYWEEIAGLIPDVRVMFGYDQNSMYHCYDLWEHSVRTVLNLPKGIPDDMLYLAALIHDIGKPVTRCRARNLKDEYAHYYGHPQKGAVIVETSVIPSLAEHGIVLSEDEQRRLLYYVRYHDEELGLNAKSLQKHLGKVSLEEYKYMVQLQLADANAHILLPKITKRIADCEALLGGKAEELYRQIRKGE